MRCWQNKRRPPARKRRRQVEWGVETELRRNLMESNSTFQRTNSDFYRQLLENDREGLDASEAY